MEYRERNTIPHCCKVCGETREALCFICEHFHEKYELADERLVLQRVRQRLLRKLLNVNSELDYYIIRWKSVNKRPQNFSYLLIMELDEELGTISSAASYEKGKFWYMGGSMNEVPVDERKILGWDYLPYDEHRDEKEDCCLDVLLKNAGNMIREEIGNTLEDETNYKEDPPQK